jgi:fructose-bisphosphate aldolase class I
VKIGVENTSENRRAYRELLFATPGLSEYISGAILFDETFLEHKTKDGSKPLCSLLSEQGILIGIKVDAGLKPLVGSNGENACTGLDGLGERCKKYYEAGARFAKWRAAYAIDLSTGKPSELVVKEQAWGLARYAAICQANGLVPVVEPEVMMDGAHGIEVCARVSQRVWSEVAYALHQNGVLLEGCLFKPNMVTPGQKYEGPKVSPMEIAEYTVTILQRCLPSSFQGVTFLSGGQTEEDATDNLNAINVFANSQPNRVPWKLSFSYGRALQHSCVTAWAGKEENVEKARAILMERAKQNSLAQLGKLEVGQGSKSGSSSESLFQGSYVY